MMQEQRIIQSVGIKRHYGMSQSLTRVIAITSGKGGVGKTHCTVNIGLALANMGKKVLLLDADFGLANINILLNFKPKATLQHVLAGTAKLREVIVSHESGLDIIPASSGIPELANMDEQDRTMLVSAVEEIGLEYDYILIDTAAGIGDNVLYFVAAAEDIIVVVDPEPTSRTDAYALIKVLSSTHGRKEFHVLSNRVPEDIDGKTVYAQLGAAADKFLNVSLKYLGAVQYDRSIVEAVISQKPYLDLFPSSKSSNDIVRIAKKIDSMPRSTSARGNVQFFLQELIRHN